MTEGWVVRLQRPNDYTDKGTYGFVGSYKKYGGRQNDTIVTYSGEYGIDNYIVWTIHDTLPHYDFSTTTLNLRLYKYSAQKIPYFQDFYRVRDVRYEPNLNQYVLFGISEACERLHRKLIEFDVSSVKYDENKKAYEVMKDVLESNNIFYVIYDEDTDITRDMPNYEYRYFNINPEWTVLDFIQYLCKDNMYEWTIDKFIDEENVPHYSVRIGHELQAIKYRNATKEWNSEKDRQSSSVYSVKYILGEGSPMEPLSHWEERFRCVWAKHTAGKGGGTTRGCFVPIGGGHFTKKLYLFTLEGSVEKSLASYMMEGERGKATSVTIGSIISDTGQKEYIDTISVQKDPNVYNITQPHKILIDDGKKEVSVQHQKENISRTTQYLESGAGLLFPSVDVEANKPPNSVIFNIDNKQESSVIGPFIMGNNEPDFIIPAKADKRDYRLQFPNGFCQYIDKDGNIYTRLSDTDPNDVEDFLNTETWRDAENYNKSGYYIGNFTTSGVNLKRFMVNLGPDDSLDWITTPITDPNDPLWHDEGAYGARDFHLITSSRITMMSYRAVTLTAGDYGAGMMSLMMTYGGVGGRTPKIYLSTIAGDIVIYTAQSGDITIQTDGGGEINIDTSGVVNLGNSASAVNLSTGAKGLAHASHIHTLPGALLQGPPSSTNACTDNTTIVKAD